MPLNFKSSTETSPDLPCPGFQESVRDAQRCFRKTLAALSQPGTLQSLSGLMTCAPGKLTPATAALCLTLLDTETSVWLGPELDCPEVRQFLSFHCGCQIRSKPIEAVFAVLTIGEAPRYLEDFQTGTPEYPDRSATLILQCPHLGETGPITLSGPGIPDVRQIAIEGVGSTFWSIRADINADFPTGLDMILVDRDHMVGLPRTTQVKG